MGTSVRSKRKKRLRSLRRELVQSHYDQKDMAKFAALEAALAGPKIEIPSRNTAMEVEPEYQGRSGVIAMTVDESAAGQAMSSLKAKKSIKKRGKSKSRLKKEKRRKKKLQF